MPREHAGLRAARLEHAGDERSRVSSAVTRRIRAGQAARRVLHHRDGDVGDRTRNHQRRPGIHHEAVRRRDPGRQVRAGRAAVIAPGRTASVANAAAAVRVMVCDDSAVIRGAVARMLEAEPSVQVVARVANGQLALDELKRTQVDVVVLDIEMPVMDGMTALPLLLRADPGLKVIMASTLPTRGADIALRALRLGAADYVPKPSAVAGDETFRREAIEKG